MNTYETTRNRSVNKHFLNRRSELKAINVFSYFDLRKIIPIFISVTIYLFAFRGNIGGIFAIVTSLMLAVSFIKSGSFKKNNVLLYLWAALLATFALIVYLFRAIAPSFYMFTSYVFACSILFFNSEINKEALFKYVFFFSCVVLASIYFQFFWFSGYSFFARFFFPANVYEMIVNRYYSGYCSGITSEVTYAAMFSVFGAFYSPIILRNKKRIIVCIVFLVGLFLTGKKASILFAFLTLIGLYLIKSKSIIKVIKVLLSFAVALFFLFILFDYWKNIPGLSRMAVFVENLSSDADLNSLTSGRVVIYQRALDLWKENKLFGIGWLNFRELGSYGDSIYTTWFDNFDVHNCYLQVLVETGYVGAICFCVIAFITIIYMTRIARLTKERFKLVAFCFALYFLLYSFTEPALYSGSQHLLFFSSLCLLFSNERSLCQTKNPLQ